MLEDKSATTSLFESELTLIQHASKVRKFTDLYSGDSLLVTDYSANFPLHSLKYRLVAN